MLNRKFLLGLAVCALPFSANALTLILNGQEYQVERIIIERNGTINVTTIPGNGGGGNGGGGNGGGGNGGGGNGGGGNGGGGPPVEVPPGVTLQVFTSSNLRLRIGPEEAYAFRFAVDSANRVGAFAWATSPGMFNSEKLVTISTVPGNFDINSLPRSCVGSGEIGEVKYNQDPSDTRACTVQPGTYYFNIKNGSRRFPDIPTCPRNRICGAVLQKY